MLRGTFQDVSEFSVSRVQDMPTQCTADRATPLVEAVSNERQPALIRAIQKSRSDMVARGMSASSMHALEIIETCALELRERAKLIWQHLQRAHKSCDSNISEDLNKIFRTLLNREKTKLEETQEIMAGPILKHLQNMSLVQVGLVSDTYDQLLAQYEAEIAMYIDNLRRGTGSNYFERLRETFQNNKIISIGAVIVVAIGALGSFTEALGRISSFFSGLLHSI
jgi:hypothetical protein